MGWQWIRETRESVKLTASLTRCPDAWMCGGWRAGKGRRSVILCDCRVDLLMSLVPTNEQPDVPRTSLMHRAICLAAVLLSLAQISTARAESTFLQLVAKRLEPGEARPAGSARPVPSWDFVARDTLPAGAKVLSAARA